MSPIAWRYRNHDDRVTRDEKLLTRIPTALLDYPLECALAAWGVVSGLIRLAFPADQGTLLELLPHFGVSVLGGLMVLGAATTIWGLRKHRYGSTVSRGLELLGTTFAVYTVALVKAWTLPSALLAGLMLLLWLLCWFRAWVLALRARLLRCSPPRVAESTAATLERFNEKAGPAEETT